MQVILLERIGRLGQMGDVVKVKDGYARNFLLPQGKALRATDENKGRFDKDRAQLEARNLELKKEAEAVAAKLDGPGVRDHPTGRRHRPALRLRVAPRHRRGRDRRRLLRRPPPDPARPPDKSAGLAPRAGGAASRGCGQGSDQRRAFRVPKPSGSHAART